MSSPADGDLAGHEELRRALLSALRRSALPHALLLTGEAGLGKRRLAQWLAAARWCAAEPPPCLTCRSCRLVATGNHPDLHVLVRNPPKEQDPDELGSRHEITVDQVRRGLIPALGVRPLEGRGRTVIIDGADELNEAAQNALLKTLEEPPHGTLLLLLAAHADALLDTVRSRCQELRLFPLTADALRALFPDADEERLHLAAGRPGRLAELTRLDVAALLRALDEVLDGALSGSAFAAAVEQVVAARADGGADDEDAAHRLAAEVCLARLRDRLAAGGPAPEGAAAALLELATDLRRHIPPGVAWLAAGIELSGGRMGGRDSRAPHLLGTVKRPAARSDDGGTLPDPDAPR
jgi:DNA polymerase III delta' subunit